MSTQTTTTDAASGAEGDLAARFEAKREESELKERATGMRAHQAYWLGRTSAFADARDMARADVAAPVTGTEGDHRELRAVMRRLSTAKNAGGIEDAEAQAQVLGHAVDTCIGQIREFLATAPQPAGAERVDLGELERLSAAARAFAEAAAARHAATMAYHAAWDEQAARGIQPRDMDLTAVGEASRKAQGAESLANVELCTAAKALVPASLPAALGRGEGTAGATPAGSGSRPSGQAPSGLDLSGFDLSRGPFADFARDLEWRATKVEREAWDSRDNLAKCHGRADGLREAAGLARVRDRSGEAGETTGSPEGKSPAPLGATPHPQSPSLSEVEEAKAVLAGLEGLDNSCSPRDHANELRSRAEFIRGHSLHNRSAYADALIEDADAIEAALATLTASQEQDSEVRDA